MANRPNRSSLAGFILILLVGAIVGSGALCGSWHFDDYYTIVRNDALRNTSNVLRACSDPTLFSADPARKMYRPVLVISYILNFRLLGDNARAFLLINLLLHLANALFVWAIARRLLEPAGEAEAGALLAGLVYAVHPAASQGIAYVSDRSAVLATFFVLSSLIAYIRWDRGGSPAALIGSATLFVLALGTKAIAIVLPAFVVIYHLWFPVSGKRSYVRAAVGILSLSILGIGYVVLRKAVMGVVLAESLVRPLKENLLTQACAYMHYLRLFLWPVNQSINPYFGTFPNASEPRVLVSLLVLGLLAVIAIVLGFKGGNSIKVFAFGLAIMLISFLPESSIVPLNLIVSERRMILPLVGFALAMGAIFGMMRFRWRNSVAICLILCMASVTMLRLRDWRSEEALWRAAVRVDPNWGLLWNNVGLIYLEKRDTLRATEMFELAAKHDSKFAEARLNLGHIYAQVGRVDKAESYYREALSINPGYSNAAVSLAQLLNETGKKRDARSFISQFVRQYPTPRALYLLGVFAEEDGQLETAMGYYKRAIAGDRYDPLPNLALAHLLVKTGLRDEALNYLRRFLSVYMQENSYRLEAIRLMSEISSKAQNR